LQIPHFETAQFLAAQAVIKKDRQDGAVALALERLGVGGVEQGFCLSIANGRRLAFVGAFAWPLDSIDGVMRNRIALAEMVKQR
jgi:hypothetical protein